MMKLNYSHKRTITTADLYDMCDPPLTFEIRTRPRRGWSITFNEFDQGGRNDDALARELVAGMFLTVSDGESVFPLDTVEQAQALQDAIEESDPGHGAEFICNIAWAAGWKYYLFIEDHLGNSGRPLEQSNGSAKAKTPATAS